MPRGLPSGGGHVAAQIRRILGVATRGKWYGPTGEAGSDEEGQLVMLVSISHRVSKREPCSPVCPSDLLCGGTRQSPMGGASCGGHS